MQGNLHRAVRPPSGGLCVYKAHYEKLLVSFLHLNFEIMTNLLLILIVLLLAATIAQQEVLEHEQPPFFSAAMWAAFLYVLILLAVGGGAIYLGMHYLGWI